MDECKQDVFWQLFYDGDVCVRCASFEEVKTFLSECKKRGFAIGPITYDSVFSQDYFDFERYPYIAQSTDGVCGWRDYGLFKSVISFYEFISMYPCEFTSTYPIHPADMSAEQWMLETVKLEDLF